MIMSQFEKEIHLKKIEERYEKVKEMTFK